MSFLDDLKKEAQQVKQREEKSRTTTQVKRDSVVRSIRPRMKKAYEYLKDACEQLNIVDPDVFMTYDVNGFGRLGPLRQSEYKVTAPDPRSLDKFSLSFACRRPDQVTFKIEGKETAVAQKEYLWSANLRFTSKFTSDGHGLFKMDAYVPVAIEFEADPEHARIVARVRNLETLGSSRIVYAPDTLDDELLEELAKCIVRKDNRFHEVSGNAVSEETRMRLRQQLEYDRYKREVEASVGGAEPEAPPKPKAKKKKKKGLLRSLFGS